jgi:hypothetical protein
MKKIKVLLAILSLTVVLTSCSTSSWEIQKSEVPFDTSVAQSPLVHSQEVLEFLQDNNLVLGADEYLRLSVGDSITIRKNYLIETFYPLRRDKITENFSIFQEDGIIYLHEGTIEEREIASVYVFIGLIFILLIVWGGSRKDDEDFRFVSMISIIIVIVSLILSLLLQGWCLFWWSFISAMSGLGIGAILYIFRKG